MTEKKLKITLIRSTIGTVAKNRKVVESMGFRKLNQSIILPDNASTKGQIRKISHMVKVEEIEVEVEDKVEDKIEAKTKTKAKA